jgi:DNA polymerase (family 10)
MNNTTIAERLNEYATYLDTAEGNVHRTRAYRRAAETILSLDRPVGQILEEGGRSALLALPGIGQSLAYTIEALVKTGEFRTLRPEGGHIDPERLLTSLPGVGPHLARELIERLGITTLEGLEMAALEGRLAEVGVGTKRLRGLLDSVACRLRRSRLPGPVQGEPLVGQLLRVDEVYRARAQRHVLPTVSPRRFNPDNEPWLPIYREDHEGWRFVALFSNTALAHRLGQTRDWVVIRFEDGLTSGQRTVVTETRGELRGLRVVRGREAECRLHYREHAAATGPEPAA